MLNYCKEVLLVKDTVLSLVGSPHLRQSESDVAENVEKERPHETVSIVKSVVLCTHALILSPKSVRSSESFLPPPIRRSGTTSPNPSERTLRCGRSKRRQVSKVQPEMMHFLLIQILFVFWFFNHCRITFLSNLPMLEFVPICCLKTEGFEISTGMFTELVFTFQNKEEWTNRS